MARGLVSFPVWMLLTAILLLALAASACEGQEGSPPSAETTTPTSLPQTTTPVTAIPPLSTASPPFQVSLPADEVLSGKFSARYLIYATEENGHSVVWKRDISALGTEEERIFEFDEALSYYQEEILPYVALSSNGTRLAYVDPGGVGVFDLETKSSERLADSLPGPGPDGKPVGEFGGACCFVHFSRPLWSSDGRFISVQLTEYESMSGGVVNTSDGSACVPRWRNGNLSGVAVAWSPTGHHLVAHSADNYSYSGLYLSDKDDPCSGDDISWVYSGQGNWNAFEEAAWSPDEKLLAFSYVLHIKTGHEKAILAVLDVDNPSSTLIDNEEENRYPIFSPDGSLVYYIKSSGDSVSLWSYSVEERQRAEVARLPPDGHRGYKPLFWTSEGFLALLSYETSDQCHYQGCKDRVIILDLNRGEVVYASTPKDSTTFLALTE